MNTSPITTWEGAEAYFTFADKPALLVLFVLAGIAACVWTIVSMAKHETKSSKKQA